MAKEDKNNLENQKKVNKAKKEALKHTKETGKELLSQRQALNDLLKLQKEGNEYKKETLGMSRDLAKFEKDEFYFKEGGIKLLRSEQELSKALLQDKTLKKQLEQKLKDLRKAGNVDQAKNLAAQLKTTKEVGKNIEEQIKNRDSINKHLGMTDNIMKGLEQIPFAKEFIDGEAIILAAEKAIHGMEDESKKTAAGMKAAFGEAFKQLDANASAMGKALTAWSLQSLVKDTIKLSGALTDVQKALNLSDKASLQLNQRFINMARYSRSTGIAVSDTRKAFMSLNEQLGIATEAIRDDIVDEMAILAKFTGLSAESQARFAQNAILSGKKAHTITKATRATVEAQIKQFGLGVNVNKVLDEAGHITGVMAANFGFSIERMAKALTISKQLGVSLEQTKGIQSGMLDFASSIENELAAELFTGKQLNLEKARLYALTNDYTNLQKEIVKQFPSIIEFEKMNYFAKERTAAALGLTADGMADILRDGKTNAQLAIEAKAAGYDDLAISYEKQSIADKLVNSQQKITESLVNMMDIFLPLIDGFATLMSHSAVLYGTLGLIAGLKILGLINGFMLLAKTMRMTAVASAVAKAAMNPLLIPALVVGMGVAGAIAGAVISSNSPSKNDLSPMDVAQIQKGEVRGHSGESLIRTNTLEALLNKASGGGNQQQNMQPVVLSVNYSAFDQVKAPTHYSNTIR